MHEHELEFNFTDRLEGTYGYSHETACTAEKISKIMMTFLNWESRNYKGIFKVNGNDSHSLTSRQFDVLIHIHHLNCNTLSQLERVLPVEGSSLSSTISKMAKNGLLSRIYPAQSTDRRICYLKITEQGEEILKQVTRKVREHLTRFVLSLDEEQQYHLVQGLDRLIELFVSLS